jgi:hypothetical protein
MERVKWKLLEEEEEDFAFVTFNLEGRKTQNFES